MVNKTLYGALTRRGYTTEYAHLCTDTYSTQLFQLKFKVFPELSGKVEYERERLNTVPQNRKV